MINIDTLLKQYNVKSVAITGHVRPDGDCVGSSIALKNYIESNYPNVSADVYLQSKPNVYSYLKGFEEIKTEPEDNKYDMLFVLDCSAEERFKPFLNLLENSSVVVNIDHHIKSGEKFSDISEIDEKSSATCELLYRCLNEACVDKFTGEALYTGIISDTGVFKYPATDRRTMETAGKLMELGFDYTTIIDETFYARTFRQSKALARALSKAELINDGKVIYSSITPDELREFACDPEDLGGVVEQLRLTKGVELAIFIYPSEAGAKKISLRSKHKVDVNRIASSYGGGGHICAAGFSTFKGVKEIVDEITKAAEKELEDI